MTRTIATLVLSFALLATSACAASHDDLQKALDGIDTTSQSLKVSSELFEQFCVLKPTAKICTGELAANIRVALAIGPLTLGEIRALIVDASNK